PNTRRRNVKPRRIGRDDSSQKRVRPNGNSASGRTHAFHRERRIPVRRGRSRYEVKPFYIRFCFPDAVTADAFRNRFDCEYLTRAPAKSKPRNLAKGRRGDGHTANSL